MFLCMKVSRVLPALACSLALVSCSSGAETVTVTATEWVDPDSGEAVTTEVGAPVAPATEADGNDAQSNSDWAAEYAQVLDNPGAHNFDLPNPSGFEVAYVPNGEYAYALVEANGGGAPELLLSSMSVDEYSNHFARVLVFSTDGGSLQSSGQTLIYGAAGAGGSRAAVEASQLGRGLYQNQWSSGTGDGESTWFDVDGANLTNPADTGDYSARFAAPAHLTVNWLPVEDRSALETGALTVALPEDPYSAHADGPDVVVEGTVVAKTGAELRPEGMPNGEDPASEYFLLQLDAPQEFTDHNHAGSVYESTTEFVSLGAREIGARGYTNVRSPEWEQFAGKRVRLTIAPQHIHFQTDASMPTGALRVARFQAAEVL